VQLFAAFLSTCWQALQTEWWQELQRLSETTVGLRLIEVLESLLTGRRTALPTSAHMRRREGWPRLWEG